MVFEIEIYKLGQLKNFNFNFLFLNQQLTSLCRAEVSINEAFISLASSFPSSD